MANNNEIPPPPGMPQMQGPDPKDFAIPAVRAWFYAGPIILDALALVCTTILVALKIVPVEDFKYLIGILVVGNMALRMPGAGRMVPPGGGGLIVAAGASILKGWKA